jgi:hypothetical protein
VPDAPPDSYPVWMQESPGWYEGVEWAQARGQQAALQESESKLSHSKLRRRDLECGGLPPLWKGGASSSPFRHKWVTVRCGAHCTFLLAALQ